MKLKVGDLSVLANAFPSGVRDFLLVRRAVDGAWEAIPPLELLTLDQVAQRIQNIARTQKSLALVLALCRLLVPCLRYRGSGRHLVVESWSQDDVRGESIPADVPTLFARDLAAAQAEDYRAVTTGDAPPPGSLPELFWASLTALPALPSAFNDPELGRLAKALYLHLVPEGGGTAEIDSAAVAAQVEACRKKGFAALQLGSPPRRLHSLFRKLLAVTVRYASQLTGAEAEDLVARRLRRAGGRNLTDAERQLLALRYGACPALSDVNVGFLFNCGPVLADLVNDYFLALAGMRPEADRAPAEELLKSFVYLLGAFQRRRKEARAQERDEDRKRHADRMPRGPRRQAEFEADPRAAAPDKLAAARDDLEQLRELLPRMKDRDAERLQAYLDCNGDRKAAAAKLGVDPKAYSQQLRQTVFPAVRQLAREEGFDPNE